MFVKCSFILFCVNFSFREVFSYDVSLFMSDAGGTMGLFLGLSLWGIFQSCLKMVDFVVRKLKVTK